MTGSVVHRLTTHCCIVGGGPAGMMLGYLLGRAGIETLALRAIDTVPRVQGLTARLIGIGVQPEHLRSVAPQSGASM